MGFSSTMRAGSSAPVSLGATRYPTWPCRTRSTTHAWLSCGAPRAPPRKLRDAGPVQGLWTLRAELAGAEFSCGARMGAEVERGMQRHRHNLIHQPPDVRVHGRTRRWITRRAEARHAAPR